MALILVGVIGIINNNYTVSSQTMIDLMKNINADKERETVLLFQTKGQRAVVISAET